MNPDLKVINYALGHIAQDIGRSNARALIVQRLDKLSRTRGISDETRRKLRDCRDWLNLGGRYGGIIDMLNKHREELRDREEQR